MKALTLLATVAAVAIALETASATETAETTRSIADILKKVMGTKCVPWQIPFLGTSLCVRFDTPGNTLGGITALEKATRTVKAMTADDSLTVRSGRGSGGGRRVGNGGSSSSRQTLRCCDMCTWVCARVDRGCVCMCYY